MKIPKRFLIPLLMLWIFLIGSGFVWLTRYSYQEGSVGAVPLRWPVASQVATSSGEAHLLVFFHPECACSRATLGELERLLPMTRGHLKVTAVIAGRGFDEKENSAFADLKERLERDTVSTYVDNGVEAALFGAKTSGQAVLFDDKGQLVFHGGLTPSRGHMGDSAGRMAILTYLAAKPLTNGISPVYGCSLEQLAKE